MNRWLSKARKLWGFGWQTRLAEHCEVSVRTVQRWVSGESKPQPRALRKLKATPPSEGVS